MEYAKTSANSEDERFAASTLVEAVEVWVSDGNEVVQHVVKFSDLYILACLFLYLLELIF